MGTERCRQHRARGRTLHLIDIENLAGGSEATAAEVVEALGSYRSALDVRSGDHVVIGSGRALLFDAGAAWPGARLLLGRGVNGADRALLEAASPVATVAALYDRVVIGSGDWIFAELVIDLRRSGLAVAVVSRADALAGILRDSACLVRRLPPAALAA